MALRDCTQLKGAGTVCREALRVHVLQGAALVPMGWSTKPGVFLEDGSLFRPAAYFRGLPAPHFPLEDVHAVAPSASFPFASDDYDYHFCGHLTGHYGHFLFAVLARLWALPRPVPPDFRLVLLNGANADDLFQLDFSRRIFEALGLGLENFSSFREPVRFRELKVPVPSFEENHRASPAFAHLCNRIGADLLHKVDQRREGRPIFLSKRGLGRGVHRVANEHVFCDFLEREGIRIVSPETLPFVEQLKLWAETPVISGMFGSMLHTSIFVPERTYVALNPEPWINSNQVLIDRLNGNFGRILYPTTGFRAGPPHPNFTHSLWLDNPAKCAADFVRAISAAEKDVARRRRRRTLLSSAVSEILSSTRRY